ncbi:MAG: TlpA family protein disulfide reductase [Gemmatimonadota bacterium]|nr:TlpA family protein disulfide reductase [Gemmatimonadota bacterium]
MTVRQQWAVVGAIVLVLAGGALGATHYLGSELFPVSVGSMAPSFSGKVIQSYSPEGASSIQPGTMRTLADYKGQVLLVNIWATWCGPCVIEMPAIERLHQALGPKGLRVIGVSIDHRTRNPSDLIRAFLREHALSFEVLHDTSDTIQDLYQSTGVPETFVIGRDGTIRKKMIGSADWSSPANRTLIEQLLAEPVAHQ